MIFNAENILLTGSILLFVSVVISKAGYRFGIPTLLLFLLVGMLFGSDGLGLQFHNAGEAQFIGMLALSIILFSGGMDTKFESVRPVLAQGILLSTVGVLLTTVLTGLFIYWISGLAHVSIALSLTTGMLLAATMSSTDSASVFNILRSQQMNLRYNLRPMLELESGSNDPMAYMLTIVLIQLVGAEGNHSWGSILGAFFVQFVVGGASGFLLGNEPKHGRARTLGPDGGLEQVEDTTCLQRGQAVLLMEARFQAVVIWVRSRNVVLGRDLLDQLVGCVNALADKAIEKPVVVLGRLPAGDAAHDECL